MEDRANRIYSMLLRMIAARSDTNSAWERFIEELLLSWLKTMPFFQEHPELVGTGLLTGDQHQRMVVWALRRGRGRQTVILLHHHDTVDVTNYGAIRDFALQPDELRQKLQEQTQSRSVRTDLADEDWLFGRGAADMKAGAVIQFALLEDFANMPDFEGNVLLLSVPDEESLSRGMLKASELLVDLRQQYGLEYCLAINSEPYFNQVGNKAILHEGSVGKIMPLVFVKGISSHISDPYNGINPSLILAAIQQSTELNTALCDQAGGEATPPPVWVNQKDRKRAYDASIPDAASGYFNWLTFTRQPGQIMAMMKDIAESAMDKVLGTLQESWQAYCTLTGHSSEDLDISGQVLDFHSIWQQAVDRFGDAFLDAYAQLERDLDEMLADNSIVLPEAALRLIEFTVDYVHLKGPAVILALSGPYYPHIANYLLPDGGRYRLLERVNSLSVPLYGVEYSSNDYFMGISDLSYVSWVGDEADISLIKQNSPGWDSLYRIPFRAVKSLQMPVLNLGPWAKDLHKATERVYLPDVVERVPYIMEHLILDILAENRES